MRWSTSSRHTGGNGTQQHSLSSVIRLKWLVFFLALGCVALFGSDNSIVVESQNLAESVNLSDEPILFIMPYTAQLNAATSRYTEVLHLIKAVDAVDRTLVEPLAWSAPFDDSAFEKTLKTIGTSESVKYARDYRQRKKLMLGEIFEGLGKYFDLSRLEQWLGMRILPYSSFPKGTVVEIDMLLVFCDRVQPAFYRDMHRVTDTLTLHIKNKTCYDTEFEKTCRFPSVIQYKNIAIVPMNTGSALYQCATGPSTKRPYGLMANRTTWLGEARQNMRWAPRLYDQARIFQETQLPGKYVAAHWRRGDKLIEATYASMTPAVLGKSIKKIIDASGGTDEIKHVFLATNSGSPDDLKQLQHFLPVPLVMYPSAKDWMDSVDHSVIEQILCTEAEWFLGAPSRWEATSAFTRFVMDERSLIGKEAQCTYQSV